MASPDRGRVIEVFGEGPTEVGHDPEVQRPTRGVVSILLHRLCGRPDLMHVKPQTYPHLQQGKGFWQKVKFARRQAYYNRSDAAVFVKDSEGGLADLKKTAGELAKGRDSVFPEFPMAIGVAHPCIESWLLADAAAIQRALELASLPTVPEEPEELLAPRRDERRNPKTVLARLAEGGSKKELSVDDKEKIARTMNDMDLMRKRCPAGFAPFADEVETYIRPLF